MAEAPSENICFATGLTFTLNGRFVMTVSGHLSTEREGEQKVCYGDILIVEADIQIILNLLQIYKINEKFRSYIKQYYL